MGQQTESDEGTKVAGRWNTVLIVVSVVPFFLWASSDGRPQLSNLSGYLKKP